MKTRIRELRELFKIKQQDIASKLNIKSPCYSNYEQERRKLPTELVIKLSKIYNVTNDFILGQDERPIKQYSEWNRYQQMTYDQASKEEKWNLAYEYSGLKDLMSSNQSIFERYTNIKPIQSVKIPLIGKIACGEPIYADQEYDTYVLAENDINADFCLICEGDSMINARILDGDIVFIRSQEMVQNGEIAAVIIEDSVTLKRVYYYPEQAKLILQAENPKYPPFIYINEELNNIRIIGKAIEFQSKIR